MDGQDVDNSDAVYGVTVLESLAALEDFGLPPVGGGYFDQPATLMMDMRAMRPMFLEKRAQSLKAAIQVQEQLARSALPDVPLPPPEG